MQSQVYSQVIFGLLSYIASYHVSANQVSIITSKAYITNLCESNCQQTTVIYLTHDLRLPECIYSTESQLIGNSCGFLFILLILINKSTNYGCQKH